MITCTFLLCFLMGTLVASSSLPHSPVLVSSKVGEKAVLPCSWRNHLEAPPPPCHVQWCTPGEEVVFEQQGQRQWLAPELVGRAQVPEEQLGSGDCSLVISDVQIGDTGRYESFMLVGVGGGGDNIVNKVFIQSVRLAVRDHKLESSFTPGDDMVLELFTPRSARVVFQGRNSSGWDLVWARQDKHSGRYKKHPEREQVTLKRLRKSDEGTYKVLDEHGLSVSTVQLYMADTSRAKIPLPNYAERLSDDATRVRCSVLLAMSTVVTSLQTFRLF